MPTGVWGSSWFIKPSLVSWLRDIVEVIVVRSKFIVGMGKLAEGLYADTSYLAGEDQDSKDVFCFLERIHPEFKAFTLVVTGRQIALDAFRYEMHR